MKKFNVVIIGAGTAGLMMAREFAKNKISTLLLEKKDDILSLSFKTLGSFIDLDKFDLSSNVVAQQIDKVCFYSKHFTRNLKGKAYILDKYLLHKELLESLDKSFVEIKTNTYINDIEENENGNIKAVISKNGEKFYSDVFIDCSGVSSVLSKKYNLIENKPKLATGVEYNVKYIGNSNEAHLFIGKEFKGGYAWIFPLKNERAIFGFGSFDTNLVKTLKTRIDSLFNNKIIKNLVIKDNDITEGGSIPITPVLTKFIHKNLVCVGDSVSQVSPIVGEGYKFIFESAYIAKDCIIRYLKNNEESFLFEYETIWKDRFLKQYLFSKMAQEKIFNFSKSDFLVDLAMLYLKYKSDKKVLGVLSGEYYRE